MRTFKAHQLILLSCLIAAHALAAPECELPNAPPAFLDLVSRDRKIEVKELPPKYTLTGINLATLKANLPRVLSSCRMTPVEITGEDPITHEPRIVKALSYAKQGTDPSRMRTVLLMPPTGGQNALDDFYANDLCDSGFRVVMVQSWLGDTQNDHDLGSHDRSALRSTAAVEDVVEYINPSHPEQLGILGTSVGAITSALILGVESRISVGTLIVGGGGMGDIIGQSTEKNLARLREERIADPAMNLPDAKAYLAATRENIKIEPLDLVKFARPKKILSFIATKDITVPTANQMKLYDAFGAQKENLVLHDDDHFGTIKFTSKTAKPRIREFFAENLREPTAEDIARAKREVHVGNKLCRNARVKSGSASIERAGAGSDDKSAIGAQ